MPSTKGTLTRSGGRLRDGQLRSAEKALEHVGARPVDHSDHDALARRGRDVLPGVGAFPEAMRRLRADGLDEVVRERATAGVPVLGICLGMQLLFERSSEHEGGARTRPAARGGAGAARARSCRTSAGTEVTFSGSRCCGGLGAAAAFYHVHSFVSRPADEADVVGRGDYGEPSCRSSSAATYGRAVPPGEVLARRPRAAAQLRRPRRVGRMILYPAIDIATGTRSGSTRAASTPRPSTTTPRSRPRTRGSSGRALPPRGRPRRRQGRRAAVARAPARDRRRHRRASAVRRRAAQVAAVREALRPGPSARSSAHRRSATSTSSTSAWTRSGRASWCPSTSRGGKSQPRAGPRPRSCRPRTRSAPPRSRGLLVRLHDADRDGALGGRWSRGRGGRGRRARALPLRGRDRGAGAPRALRGLRQVNLAGVIVGKALYERRFTVAEGQAALDGR